MQKGSVLNSNNFTKKRQVKWFLIVNSSFFINYIKTPANFLQNVFAKKCNSILCILKNKIQQCVI